MYVRGASDRGRETLALLIVLSAHVAYIIYSRTRAVFSTSWAMIFMPCFSLLDATLPNLRTVCGDNMLVHMNMNDSIARPGWD